MLRFGPLRSSKEPHMTVMVRSSETFGHIVSLWEYGWTKKKNASLMLSRFHFFVMAFMTCDPAKLET